MSVIDDKHPADSGFRRDLSLLLWQVRYEQRAFWRNRQRGIFTFVFPLLFLVIFGSIYKSQTLTIAGHSYPEDYFFVPGILAYGVISASYVNLAISTAMLRDHGVLKRMQGTPLPNWAYIGARIASSVVVVFLMSVITFVFARVAYSVEFPLRVLPAVFATLLLGTAAMTTLGVGITAFIKSAEAAPVVVNLTVLPLTFISGIWFPVSNLPSALRHVASFFPLKPLAGGLQHALYPLATSGARFDGQDLRDLAIWALVGVLLMRRSMRTPEGDRR